MPRQLGIHTAHGSNKVGVIGPERTLTTGARGMKPASSRLLRSASCPITGRHEIIGLDTTLPEHKFLALYDCLFPVWSSLVDRYYGVEASQSKWGGERDFV